MILRVIVVAAGVVIYAFLWVLAAHGVTSLVAPLVVPVVLAVLIWAGIALERFIGITPRRPKFPRRDDEDDT